MSIIYRYNDRWAVTDKIEFYHTCSGHGPMVSRSVCSDDSKFTFICRECYEGPPPKLWQLTKLMVL